MNKMSEEASVGNNIHIGPVINLNTVGKVESDETINVICCACSGATSTSIKLFSWKIFLVGLVSLTTVGIVLGQVVQQK